MGRTKAELQKMLKEMSTGGKRGHVETRLYQRDDVSEMATALVNRQILKSYLNPLKRKVVTIYCRFHTFTKEKNI